MTTPHVLLGLLVRGPRHGYELKREHDARFPQAKPLPYGQVYATLARHLRDGLVELVGTEPGDGPDRSVYALTTAGREHLDAWLSAVEAPAPFLSSTMLAKVVLAALVGEPAETYLKAQRAAHLQRMRELARITTDPSSSVSDVLAADYALSHLDADVRWVETTRPRLTTLTTEVRAS